MWHHHVVETPSSADVSQILSNTLTNKHLSCFVRFILPVFFVPELLFSQTDSATVIREVVVQSTRVAAQSPVPHTNIKAEAIAKVLQAQDIPFLLTQVPSLVESSDAGAGTGYTGLRIRGSDPTRVNVTINGVPLNDAESQGVFWVNMPDLAASASEIQVQRGVGASTNGAGAFGATVNIDLSGVAPEPAVQLTNSYGSFNTRKHSIRLHSGLLNNRFAVSGRFSTVKSAGYVDRASANLHAWQVSGSWLGERQSLQMQLLSGREITYQAWYGLPAQYLEVDSLRRFNPAGTERDVSPHPNEVDNYTQRHHLLHYRLQIHPNWLLQLNGHYTRGYGYFEQYKAQQSLANYLMPAFISGNDTVNSTDLIRRRWLDNHFAGSTFALKWNGHRTQINWGGAFSHYAGAHFGEVIWANVATAPNDHRYYDNDATKVDFNLYTQLFQTFNAHWQGFLDLQIRRIGYQFWGFDNDLNNVTQKANLTFFNPKMGLNCQINPQQRAYLFGGIANREPNRDDFTQSTPNSRPQAETLYNLESGWAGGGARWQVGVNGYLMYYRNQLVLDGRINDVGAYIRTNVPESYRLGVEVETRLSVHPRCQLNGHFALSRNRVQRFVEYRDDWDTGLQSRHEWNNVQLAFSPNYNGRLEATWQCLRGQPLWLSVGSRWVGQQLLDNTGNRATALPAYSQSDLRINYDLTFSKGPQMSFILAVNNIFNQKYVSNGWVYRFQSANYDPRPDNPYTRSEGKSVYHQAGFFPQAGTHWAATVTLRW
jgi:iron complex outermembrane recepter protein